MSIDFTPLLQLPEKEKLALVKLLVDSMQAESTAEDAASVFDSAYLQKLTNILQRVEQKEIHFYPLARS
jgi:hypothetical protein